MATSLALTTTGTGNLISDMMMSRDDDESTADDHDSRNMMMSRQDDVGSSAELIALVGDDVKYCSLMKCVEAWSISEFQIDEFQAIWPDKEAADRVINCLANCPTMFEIFVRSCPLLKYSIGKTQLFREYAIEKFRVGRKKLDLLMML